MSDEAETQKAEYFREAESWATDRDRLQRATIRTAWIIASIATVIALVEAVTIAALVPLKTVVPYTLLVDRQTGYVEALKPLERDSIAPDRALTRSLIAQYVIAREGFDISSLKDDYRKVALWSAGDARDRYVATMQASNPASPLATLPRRALLEVQIRGISPLSADTTLVRFVTIRSDPGGQPQEPQPYAAVVTYRFSAANMTAADRLLNPLGFQVTRYRRDAEIPPPVAVQSAVPSAVQPGRTRPVDAARIEVVPTRPVRRVP